MNMQRLPSDIIGLSKVMPPLVAARFHDEFSRGCGRLHARRRPGARRRHPHRHQRPRCRRRQGQGAGRRHAGLLRAPGRRAEPADHSRRMEIFGLHEYIKDVTRRLGHLGAFAVAPDYYFRAGPRHRLTKITDMQQLFPIVNAKTDTELFADLDATVAWAKSQGGDANRLGIMGFCRGGRTVWHYSTHNPEPQGRRRVLRHAGRQERRRAEEFDRAGARSEGAGAWPLRRRGRRHQSRAGQSRWRLRSRPPARPPNSTSIPARRTASIADYRPSYRKEAAEDAWNRMIGWFKKYEVLS